MQNLIHRSWADPAEDTEFSIHEQDRHVIREAIVGAITHVSPLSLVSSKEEKEERGWWCRRRSRCGCSWRAPCRRW